MRERGGGEEGGGSEQGEGEKRSLPFMVGGARCVFVLVGRRRPSVVSCQWRLASFFSITWPLTGGMTWPLTGGMPFHLESSDAGSASGQSRVVVAC